MELTEAVAGDIVSIAGLPEGTVTNTLNAMDSKVVIPVNQYNYCSLFQLIHLWFR